MTLKERLTARLPIMFTPSDRERIEKAAEKAHRTVSDYARTIILNHLDKQDG